ncbi:phosphoribosylglycinamide formyltransferase [candidate division KSB1 bacterium]|nr:phosphoribosylglycinamide formyltransferase [candidate division KSB1 bacterium]MBL7092536.1 phosphoribosylglycinamide formyltransferase [candidate division KSB1 bacterium]
MEKLKIAVLASGRGSNFKAVLDNIKQGKLNAEICVVISNKKSAGALEIARENQIPAFFVSAKQLPEQSDFDDRIMEILDETNANFIILAGYLKMIGKEIVRKYKNRILNIHPALLPSFGGKGMYGHFVHEAVLNYGCRVSGVTVHLVDEKYDTGLPIIQRCVPVKDSDTPETLAARVLKEEHKVFTEALRCFAENRIEIDGKKVKIRER